MTTIIAGKRVLDFGCGTGEHTIHLAELGASKVIGLDINERWLAKARANLKRSGVADHVEFQSSPIFRDAFDVVFSLNSMEHYGDPHVVLTQIRSVLTEEGRAVVSFSPPWLSPYGAHMHFFTPIPWVHLLFPESAVLEVRARYKCDGATTYEEVEGGLNKMTIARFLHTVAAAGFAIDRFALTPVKGIPIVTHLPLLREFFTTRVVAVLRPTVG